MFLRWEFIEGGIKKVHSWGYSIVHNEEFENCFSSQELDEVIIKLGSLPSDSLSNREHALLGKLKAKRKIMRK